MKSLLLIGPGRYFGKEILQRFAVEGVKVGFISQQEAVASSLRESLRAEEVEVDYELADITNAEELTTAIHNLCSRLDNLSYFVYNPKFSPKGSGLEVSTDDFHKSLQVNVLGATVAIQAALPHMRKAQDPQIILTGGGYKDKPDPNKFALSVGKASLHTVGEALKEPLAEESISLKTVVIDGYVREEQEGAIDPTSLASFFWQTTQEEGFEFKYSALSERER